MKRTFALFLTLCMVLSLCACGNGKAEEPKTEEPVTEAAAPAVPSRDIAVIYTNDVHCGVDDGLGYAAVSRLKSALTAEGKTVLLADCGDHSQGDVVGALSKGEYIIEIMNQIGYDFAIPGNHEFDYGMAQFLSNAEKADYPYLSCNFADKDGKLLLQPYAIVPVNGVKLAFVGISTPESTTSSRPSNFQDENGNLVYSFFSDATGEKLYTRVQETVDAARAEGADYVVALAHLGIELDASPWMSTDVITHTTGIDVMLDGHSHSVIEGEQVKNAEGRQVLLTSTGTKLQSIGCLTLDTDGRFRSTLITEDNFQPYASADDNGTAAFLTEVEARNADLVNKVVAHSDVELTTMDPATGFRMIRSNETNLGDLVADAYRILSGADVAIANGGGIRADIPAGDITYGQIIAVHPFGNEICVCETTGQELLDMLEVSVDHLPAESGGFQQVSGISFTVDMAVDSTVVIDENDRFVTVEGARRVRDVMIDGEPLDPEKTYTIASHNFTLKEGGSSMSMFMDNHFTIDCVMLDYQILIDYIADTLGGTVGEDYADVYGQGRINIING